MEDTINITDVANSLGLTRSEGALFFGKVSGFPVGFQVIDPQEMPLVLFHVRHPFAADAKEVKAVQYGAGTSRLMADKKLEIEFDRQIAWVSFIDGVEVLRGDVKKQLDEILTSFAAAGLARNPDLCHYCQNTRVEALSCRDGKVLQICPQCLKERTGATEKASPTGNVEFMPVLLLATLAGLVGATGWAICWVLYEVIFLTGSNVIYLKLEALVAFCAGAAAGCPVGFVVRRFGRRGRRLSFAIAGVSSLLGAVVGELAFVSWLIYREYHVLSPGAALKILPQVELGADPFHVVTKVLALVVAIGFAIGLTKSAPQPKPSL